MSTLTLSDGRVAELRMPKAGELRGVKLLDLLQLDPAAHAVVLERTSDLTALEFYELGAADALALMGEVAGFFRALERLPECVDDAWAVIATAWGWGPSEMVPMGLAELMAWEHRAEAVLKARGGAR